MSVDDMLKAIAISSGNDAAVAMAEFVAGSEDAFVEMMNKKAAALGCENTHFATAMVLMNLTTTTAAPETLQKNIMRSD